jgi:pimeloyl-ACP methyl ester carboxylesterase
MSELEIAAPLASLRGEPPAAPDWFVRALADRPERDFVTVAGARIETLSWGESGQPGLLLLHGSGAHADWYSFIAPYLARRYRVVAMSWSGMGGSDWRETYSREIFVEEALTVAERAGLFANEAPPVVLGHSFGARIAIALAAAYGERLGAVILVDPPIFSPQRQRERKPRDRPFQAHRIYPTFEAALARFRFAPPQPCANLFLADHIARLSLKSAVNAKGERGWTWRFDPFLWRDMRFEDPAPLIQAMRCPAALLRGGASRLMLPADAAYVRGLLPKESPYVEIPEADHHVMVDQPLAFISAVEALLAGWPPPPAR